VSRGLPTIRNHVVWAEGVSPAAVLDGFVVQGGHANGGNREPRQWRRIMIFFCKLTVRNCRIENNTAYYSVGGLYACEGDATITVARLSATGP